MTILINQEVDKLTRISNDLHDNTWKDWWQKKEISTPSSCWNATLFLLSPVKSDQSNM